MTFISQEQTTQKTIGKKNKEIAEEIQKRQVEMWATRFQELREETNAV